MPDPIEILIIDDDKVVQKIVSKALKANGFSVRVANDGESGLEEVSQNIPDFILLDIEMPGINGYEVCTRLKEMESTKNIPVIFLSSHSSLRERLQGYEVGASDYLVKPFDDDYLLARINILIRYKDEHRQLQADYEQAQKTAMIAMTSSSELGQAMNFLEKSVTYNSIDALAQGFLNSTSQYSLLCCLMVLKGDEKLWYSTEGSISPLEKELIEMSDRDTRFLDFGERTLVNYPSISLLIKNMPLDDQERYGRIKDLAPVLMAAANSRVNNFATENALAQHSQELVDSFRMIRNNLFSLGQTIVNNRSNSLELLNNLVQDLHSDLLRMGLEEDQEEYLLDRVDTSIEEAMQKMDAGKDIRASLTFILTNLQAVKNKQEVLLSEFSASLLHDAIDMDGGDDDDGDIELF